MKINVTYNHPGVKNTTSERISELKELIKNLEICCDLLERFDKDEISNFERFHETNSGCTKVKFT